MRNITKTDVNYLEKMSVTDFAVEYKKKSYEVLDLQEDFHILDLGCGAGNDVLNLANMVPKGKVIGVDINEEAIELCNKKKNESGMTNIEFILNDGEVLPFDDETFDAVRSDRVFQHLTNPRQVMAELYRVTKPGGKINILDTDWGTIIINSAYTELTWKINKFRLKYQNNPYAGRSLYQLFREFDINIIDIEARTMMLTELNEARELFLLDWILEKMIEDKEMTVDEKDKWMNDLIQKDENDRFFSSLSGFIFIGEK